MDDSITCDVTRRRIELAAILRLLEKKSHTTLGIDSFNSRLMIQKSVYLLKAMGYPPVKSYNFSSYLRGPYSPDLAEDYFAVCQEGYASEKGYANIPPDVLNPVVEGIKKGVLFLEAATTIHSIVKYNPHNSKNQIVTHVRFIKPHVNFVLEEAWRFLMNNGLISRRLT